MNRSSRIALGATAALGSVWMCAPAAHATGAEVTVTTACSSPTQRTATFTITNPYTTPIVAAGYGVLAGQAAQTIPAGGTWVWRPSPLPKGSHLWGVNYDDEQTGQQVTSTGNQILTVEVASCVDATVPGATTTTTVPPATTTTTTAPASTTSTTIEIGDAVTTTPTVPPTVVAQAASTFAAPPVSVDAANMLPRTGGWSRGALVLAVVLVLVGAGLVLVQAFRSEDRP